MHDQPTNPESDPNSSEDASEDTGGAEACPLHVFTACHEEWAVGRDLADALAAYTEWAHLKVEDLDAEVWEQLPDEQPLSLVNEDRASTPRDRWTTTTKTCGEWAASNGRGFLASTEY